MLCYRYTLCGVYFFLDIYLCKVYYYFDVKATDYILHCLNVKYQLSIVIQFVERGKIMMKTNATNQNNATEKKLAFSELLKTYVNEYENGVNTASYTQALSNLAYAVAYSVLKKCINTGYNETLVSIRHELTSGKANIENIEYCLNHATKLSYNDDGNLISKTINDNCKKALATLTSATLGDGLDLVNDAIVAILDETKKQLARNEKLNLEKPYTVRRLKKKVWIKSCDSVNGWESVETTPIREVFKAVRRSINTSRAMATDARSGYSYIEELSTDVISNETSTIYRRLTRYADLGGYETDFNGACTFYTVDNETVENYDELLTALNLTKRQAQVIKLRESGYGYKAIATYLGIRPDSVRDIFKAIQKKVKKCDCFNPSIVDRYTK